MKDYNERFSPETQRELQGIYVVSIDEFEDAICIPICTKPELLTAENFGIILDGLDGIILTVDDFQWYEDDGSERDFKYDNSDEYLASDYLPNEVVALLNTVICTKFATRQLNEAKSMLEDTDKEYAKKELNESIFNFENTSDSKEKLEIASTALKNVALVFDSYEQDFENDAQVIDEVLSEI